MTKKIHSKDALLGAAAASRTLPTLGLLSWWSISAVEIEDAKLRELVLCNNLPQTLVPDLLDKSAAFKRACAGIENFYSLKPVGAAETRLLVRKIAESAKCTQFAFVREELPIAADTDPKYDPIGRLTFDKESGAISTMGGSEEFWKDPSDPLTRINTAMTQAMTHHNSSAIRGMILHAIKDNYMGIGIRPNGGIYFTSRTFDADIDNIGKLVTAISPESIFFTLGIVDAEKTRTNMFNIMQMELAGELKQEAEALELLISEPDKIEGHRRALTTRLKNFEALYNKADLYEGLLQMSAASLKKRIDAAQKKVQNVIDGMAGKT